jgi:hypothetical protein
MIKELIEKTIDCSVVWIKLYTNVFTLRIIYKDKLYILFSSRGCAHLKICEYNGKPLETVSNDEIRELFTEAKKQFFGSAHNQNYKRK